MKHDWKGKVVLVTGASSGIGRALASELGRRGARLGLTARRGEELLKLGEEIERAGGEALALPSDVRDPAAMQGVSEHVRKRWGRIDVLVAIASLASYRGMPKSGAYSASKAAVSTLFESLRVDLRKSNIAVTTIHPGFIRTPMTAGRKKKLPFLLEPEDAACRIIKAVERRARTYAFPWQLASLVRVLRHVPGAVYDRLASNSNFRE